MAIFQNFPYTDLHNLNLNEIVRETLATRDKVDSIAKFIDDNISELVAQYIAENIDRYYIQAIYDEPNRALLINLEEI